MNIDSSDSSDDEKNSIGGKKSKLKIADVVIIDLIIHLYSIDKIFVLFQVTEQDEHSSAEEKEKEKEKEIIEPIKPVTKKIRKKKITSTKRVK